MVPFDTIDPSRCVVLTLPNDFRVAVLDSPSASAAAATTTPSATTAAMWVPRGRESDWIFTTFSGHLHLLQSSQKFLHISRLILLTNSSNRPYDSTQITHLLRTLTPKLSSRETPEVPFLVYEDGVVRCSVLEVLEGDTVGEMLVEDVELETESGAVEYRRRLRFKRMPNFVQSQIKIRPKNEETFLSLDSVEFELDRAGFVQPYLDPMASGISVISRFLDGRFRNGAKPRALCLGVGGGVLLEFLRFQLDFEVLGIEEDKVVLHVAKKYFGLKHDQEFMTLRVANAMSFAENSAENSNGEGSFDVVMVDLDSSDVAMGICAPPLEFAKRSIVLGVRKLLSEGGVMVVNVIPSSEEFYERLMIEFREVFEEVYEINVGNDENFVVVATKSKVEDGAWFTSECVFLNKLRSVVSGSYIDSIRKIPKC